MPADPCLVLLVAGYDDPVNSSRDFIVLRAAEAAEELMILSAEMISRAPDGRILLREHESGIVSVPLGWGAACGLTIGLFNPVALATTIAQAGVADACREVAKHHDAREWGAQLEQYLAPGGAAIVVLAEEIYTERLDRVLGRADRREIRKVNCGDVARLDKALGSSGSQAICMTRGGQQDAWPLPSTSADSASEPLGDVLDDDPHHCPSGSP